MAYLCSASTSVITALYTKTITTFSNPTMSVVFNKIITTKSTTNDKVSIKTKQPLSQIIGTTGPQYTVTPTTETVVKILFAPMNSTTTPVTGKSRPGTGQFWPR